MTSVRDYVDQPPAEVTIIQKKNHSTRPREWTRDINYSKLAWKAMDLNFQAFANEFPLDDTHKRRMSRPFTPTAKVSKNGNGTLNSKQDAHEYFRDHIQSPVDVAWSLHPLTFRQNATLPDYLTKELMQQPRVAVMVHESFQNTLYHGNAQAVCVVHVREPGAIDRDHWTDGFPDSKVTEYLAKDLIGCAHVSNCYQAVCFDGLTFLALRLPCERTFVDGEARVQEILKCEPQVWVIPVQSCGDNVTARRAFYSLVNEGYQRSRAARLADSGRLTYGHYTLWRSPFSGCEYWRDANGNLHNEHPDLRKDLKFQAARGDWVWVDHRGVLVHEEIGVVYF